MSSWKVAALALLISWGGFAFGAVYPWAFVPLFMGAAALGLALTFRVHEQSVWLQGAMLLLVLVAIGVQLIPFSAETIARVSPETDALLRRISLGYPDAISEHAFSINPPATLHALGAAAALSLLLVGLMGNLTRDDAIRTVHVIAAIGIIMAMVGVVQQALWNGKIYGFWKPITEGMSFGPFVNRNHFAGWMLMAIPLVFASFCGRVAKAWSAVEPGFRTRLLWFGSREASQTMLIGLAVLVMAIALAMSQSRSGIIGLAAAAVIAALIAGRGPGAWRRRLLVVGAAAVVMATVISGIGFERLASRFDDPDLGTWGNRAGVWRDTWTIGTRFPLVGTGMNTFGDAMLVFQTGDLGVHYNEAHNEYLQLFAEGGFLVLLPTLAAVVVFGRAVRGRFRQVVPESSDYWIRVGALTGILAVALQSLVDFSLQMPGNAVLFVVILALAARRTSSAREHP